MIGGPVTRVLLVGMMGAGKSTVGRIVAGRLGWDYLDSDDEIVRSTGSSVPEIFAARGEAAFRAEEARVLAEATGSAGPAVVSVAGGAVLDPANRRRIGAAGLVVWLRAGPAVLSERVGDGSGRPLLGAQPHEALERLYDARRPLYEALAEVTLDVDGLTPDEVAEAVLAAVEGRGSPVGA
ncbi:MAG: shikimate kinase [Acidimicrobiales bacterium]